MNNKIPDKCMIYPILYVYLRKTCTRHVFTKCESCQMKFLKPTNDKLINQTSCKYVYSRAIYLVPLINPNVNKATDHVTFLHIGYTIHWHTQTISDK